MTACSAFGPTIRICSPIPSRGPGSGRIVPACRQMPGRWVLAKAPSRQRPRSAVRPRTCCDLTARPCSKRPRLVPSIGSLYVVFQSAKTATGGQRLLGWEDSDVGKHGLSLMPEPGARCKRSCETTVRRETWSIHEQSRASRLSVSPGVRTARRCTAMGSRPVRARASSPCPPTRASRRLHLEDRAPGAVLGFAEMSRRSVCINANWTMPRASGWRPTCTGPGSRRRSTRPPGPNRRAVRRAAVGPGAVLVAGGCTQGTATPRGPIASGQPGP